jgi:outer membrane autotransporter protein
MKFIVPRVRVRGLCVVAVVSGAAMMEYAALAGPLDDFARNHAGSGVQVGIATAIQTVCPQLVATFGGMANALAAPESARKDITLRCNELISTATDLDSPNTTPPRSLNYSDPDDLLAALQQVTGEESASAGTLTARAANSQFSNVAARLGALRMAATGAGSTAPATAFNLDLGRAPLGGGASGDENADGSAELSRGGFFLNGNFNTGDRDASDLEDGFDFDAVGLTFGFDHRFDAGVLGLSVGYDSFESDFETSALVTGGGVDADGTSLSLFGMKELGDKFYIDGVVSFGSLSYDVSRVLFYESGNFDPACQCVRQERTFTSDPDADHYGVSFTFGGQIFKGAWLIQPSFVASFRRYEIDGYAETDSLSTGGMALRFGDQTVDSTESIIGVQFSRAINRSFGVLRPYFNIEWYHEFEDDPTILQAKYSQEDTLAVTNASLGFSASIENCLSCFQISSAPPDENFAVAGVGLSFVFANFKQLLLYYEGLAGYDDLSSHSFTINFRRQF